MWSLIVAADRNWGIGRDGRLIWHLSGDLKWFKEHTVGKTIIMGRTTLEGLPGGRGLPRRRNIVLTSRQGYQADRAEVVHSVPELLAALEGTPDEDIMVTGGAHVYEEFLDRVGTAWITKVDAVFDADAYFPDLDAREEFKKTWESDVMEENGIRYRFLKYERI